MRDGGGAGRQGRGADGDGGPAVSKDGVHPRYREVAAAITARRVESDIDPTLERVAEVLDLLGDPQRNFRVVHVTGTNGKTSTARMIDALLRERRLRVGRYTSPHLRTMRERIVVDGEAVTEEEFVAAYDDVVPYVRMVDDSTGTPLSFFEVLTVMSYALFADAPVDVAVVEVGMGGTWDATNTADGDVAVVTPIGIDHTEFLPDTVDGIAEEKAGIIKPGAIAVLAQQPLEAAEVLVRRASEADAVVAREGIEFGVRHREVAVGGQLVTVQGLRGTYEGLFLPLYGAHQAGNAAVAIAAAEAFAAPGEGDDALDPELVATALAGAEAPGRLEVVRRGPTVMVDAAHNPAGMAATAAAVEESFGFTRLVGLVSILADKDVEGILEPLEPLVTEIVVTRNSSPRALPAAELAGIAEQIFGHERVHTVDRMDDAIAAAVNLAEETGETSGTGVLITGSVVTAGDAGLLLKGE
ncbi:folylpolyglutamate synthase/dihydrofolate synthase family protein [Nocardiopsis coralliicola]